MPTLQRPVSLALTVVLLVAVLTPSSSPAQAQSGPQYGDIIGPVTAGSMGIHLPTTQAEYERLTSDQHAYITRQLYGRLPEFVALVESGAVSPRVIAQSPVRSSSGGGRQLRPDPAHIFVSYGCVVQASDVVGGSWMRGGGWTTAAAWQSWISVEVAFYRDGGQLWGGGVVGQGTNAERYSPWTWKNAWDHHRWLTQSWHSAEEPSGHYNLGPGRYCEASAFY